MKKPPFLLIIEGILNAQNGVRNYTQGIASWKLECTRTFQPKWNSIAWT